MKEGLLKEATKDILVGLLLFALLGGLLYAYSGTWPPAVSVSGESMKPKLIEGDLVVIKSPEKAGIVTHSQGIQTGYRMFGDYGDVIVYRPAGDPQKVPVIHRAMYWVDQGQPMWPDGPPAPNSGYITLGDNNFLYDQCSSVSQGQPVSPQWILGVSEAKIPYLGLIKAKLLP